MSVQANVTIKTVVQESFSADLATYTGSPTLDGTLTFSTTDVTKVYSDSSTISTPTTLDVTALTGANGQALSFGTVKHLVVRVSSATGTLTVGGGSDALMGSDQWTVGPNGKATATTTQFAVTTNTDLLLTPSASLTYEVLILGT